MATTPVRHHGELLERSYELQAISRALDAAAAGDGSLLAFEGPAGIGKTQLLDAARASADELGFRVLAARGGELERDFAYGVVRQLLERVMADAPESDRERLLAGPAARAAAAIGVEPTAVDGSADDQSFAVRHGLYWLVANLAAHGAPLLIAVDDVQWADAPSLRFLAYLVRRLDGIPVLVAVTVRTAEAGIDDGLVAELVGDPAARRVVPAPLSAPAIKEMLTLQFGEPVDTEFAAACMAATSGNPFLVRELGKALAEDRLAPAASNAARVAEVGPRTVARWLVLRLARVSPAAVALARAVAVLGATADPSDAVALAGLTEAEGRVAFDALAAAGVLAPERPLRFTHPILRAAVYRDLLPGERDTLHAQAASLLTTAGAPASEVAPHLLATPSAGSPETVATLREAARVALGQGAADVAVRHLRRALEEPPPAAGRSAVAAELGRAEWLAGDPGAAVVHLREALDARQDQQTRVELVIALARAAVTMGDIAAAAAVIDTELADAHDATREQILLLEAERGAIRMLHRADPEFEHSGRLVKRFAHLPGETIAEMLVLTQVAAWHWLHGTAEEAAAVAERSLGSGRAVEAVGGDSIAVLQAVYVLSFAERHDLVRTTVAAALEAARRTGSIFALSGWQAMLALDSYRRGDIVHAEAEARSGIGIPELPPLYRPTMHAYLALALIDRGALEEAENVLARSGVGPRLPLLPHMNVAFYARGLLRIAQGRLEEAFDDLETLGARDAKLHIENPGFPWRVAAARLLASRGEVVDARRLAEDHLQHARRWGTAGAVGIALHGRAMVADPLDLLGLEEAVAVLARSPARLDEARALVDLGMARRVAGMRTAAQEALRAGLERARGCGATGLVRRAHEELITAGARPRRLQFSGLEALTASERRICEHAASGLSNREIAQQLFITPKTVENHLGRAYVKLGIGSRDSLGDVLGDEGKMMRDAPS